MLKQRNELSQAELTYESRVLIFDSLCKGCPYAVYECINVTAYTSNIERQAFKTFEEALRAYRNGRIERYCTFNDEHFSLKEITDNGCYFWGDGEKDEGIFIEVTKIEGIKIETRDRETVFTESHTE